MQTIVIIPPGVAYAVLQYRLSSIANMCAYNLCYSCTPSEPYARDGHFCFKQQIPDVLQTLP